MLRRFVFIYALVFLVIATLGCVVHEAESFPAAELSGLFRVSGFNMLVHLLIGLAGLAAAMGGAAACRIYARMVGITYVAVGVLRLLSPATLGLVPLSGSEIALHTLSGAIAMNLGFSRRFALPRVIPTPPVGRFLHAREFDLASKGLLAGAADVPKAH
ncbi:MAG: DUF4383 domain-containing protein [bacterium]